MQQTQSDSWSGDKTSPSRNPNDVDPNSLNRDPHTKRVEHQAISEGNPFSESGKDVSQIHAPIVSLHPSSDNKEDQQPKNMKHLIMLIAI